MLVFLMKLMQMKNFFKLCSFIVVGGLAGCATPSEVQNMVVRSDVFQETINASFAHKIAVEKIEGGSETIPFLVSQVSDSDFKAALEESLKNAGYLSKEQPEYKLSAHLVNLEQPFIGFNFTVRATVDYKIVAVSNNQAVFEETIESAYTTKVSDSLIGVSRLRIANEGAIKRNIELMLKKLSAPKSII